ncbi:MAG TPA: carboxylating nicotinate-nucleotide diphosphorylase [candidate division Zixibacteria bacterium]|nr:carboxylating nicotinate-nucleotide diphosphorylase [candidate division Zixibacteria bacterium]
MSEPNLADYLSEAELRAVVSAALAEDIGAGDITTQGALGSRWDELERARLVAKADGVLAGQRAFALACEIVADTAGYVVEFAALDGERFATGDALARITAPRGALLSAERTALNFLGRLSGIATLTAKYVQQVKHTACVILDTRKTTPGLRALEKYAVRCGGGENHRRGLYDMALIKENHILAAGSLTQAVENVCGYLKEMNLAAALEVEIRSESELREALECGVTRLLLDNQSTASLRRLVEIARSVAPAVKLEASGNVTLANVAEIAETGVDYISVGALTHSAPVADLSLIFEA